MADNSLVTNSIEEWQWFSSGGDPAGPTVQNPTVCYDNQGCYTISLGVTDEYGCITAGGILTVPNAVCVNDAMLVDFEFNQGCDPGSPYAGTLNLDANPFNSTCNCTWYVDGTLISNDCNPTYDFGDSQSHDVTVEVECDGCSGTTTETITPGQGASCSFTIPSQACEGEDIPITNTCSADSWNWTVSGPSQVNYVSGSNSSQNPTIQFSVDGTYDVEVVATIGNCTATATQQITIGEALTVDFTGDTLEGCTAPFPVNFTPQFTGNPTTYSWNFGAGTPATSSNENPGQVNFPEGCNTVSLTVGNGGCSVTETKSSYICVVDPEVEIDIPYLYNRCIPVTVPFSDITNHQIAVVDYVWDFGFGPVTGLGPNPPPYVYTTSGTHIATLTITNATGCTATSNQIIITVDESPIANFEVSDTLVCPGETVSFTNLSTDTSDTPYWQWNFDDSNWFGGSNQRDPVYAFTDSGYHDICLTVYNLGCENTLCLEDLIRVHPPELNFSLTRSCENRTEVFVEIDSDSPPPFPNVDDDYYWDFGETPPTTVVGEPSYTHTYTPPGGEFTVCLYSSNDSVGCNNSTCRDVEIYNPIPAFTPSETETCPDTIFFTDYPVYGVDMLGWDFGDQDTVIWTYPYYFPWNQVYHVYDTSGYYDVTLIVEVSGIDSCYDTLIVENLIHILGVGQSADFSYDPISVCDNDNFCFEFTDESPTGEVSSWEWEFGDSTTSNDTNPTHCYQNWTGSDTVTLEIVDLDGCSSEVTQIVEEPPALETSVIVSASVACQNQDVDFLATPSDPNQVDSLIWHFGDNWSFSAQAPNFEATHAYDTNGVFNVVIETISISGCVDSDTLFAAVSVDDPHVSFTATPNYDFCPSVFVEFCNYSYGGFNQYLIEFGDGSIIDPVPLPFDSANCYPYIYPQFGVYDACLIAYNQAGCADTTCIPNVLDPCGSLGEFNLSDLDTANCAPFNIEVSAFNPSDTCYSYTWDFGDSPPVINAPTVMPHSYQNPGTYVITQTMRNNINPACFIVDTTYVTVAPMSVSAWGDTTICFGDSAQIHSEVEVVDANPLGYTYQWSPSGELSADSLQNPIASPNGTTTFTVIGGYSDCYSTDSVTVSINQLPLVTQQEITGVCDDDSPFALSGGDPTGGTYSGMYVQNGIFNPVAAPPGCDTIYYTVVDNNGCQNTDSNCVIVNPLPEIEFAHIDSLCNDAAPYVLTEAQPSGGFYSGNGVINDSIFNPPSVVPGTFIISYTFTDTNVCVSIRSDSITVNPNPQNDFSVADFCLGDSSSIVNNTEISSGIIQSSYWTFSDNNLDSLFTPSAHLFVDTGLYSIELVSISELGCTDILVDTILVHPVPKADFSVDDVCLTHPSLFFDQSTVSSGNIVNWDWTFPDFPFNINGPFPNPEHVFSTYGNLPVTLIVSTEFDCSDSVTHNATVQPLPVLSTEHDDRCFGEFVEFQGVSTIPSGSVVSYEWSLGDGATSQVLNPTHLYSNPGFYDVQFTGTSNLGCSDSVLMEVEIFELPHAGFTVFPDTEGCEPFTVTFIDSSSIPYPYYIANRFWDNGSGSTSEEVQPTFQYDTAGVYDVSLTAISNKGCVDSTFTADYITVHPNPTAGFSYLPEYISSFFSEVAFNDLSNGASTWYWSFGDSQFSVETDPEHFYADTGDYRVIQIVSNEFQCTDTAKAILTVWPQPTFYIPNSFTPNNDGVNETFFGQGYGIKELTMKIFDRWGEELFVTNDLNTSWDGTYKGAQVEQGVYVYLITTITVTGEFQQYAGHVTLNR
jgi:gliding motility-associated-like protein